jgi:hypothetical protein|tara:strand:+ start:453 stop:623 length:171 start_codon:yes stop_codon:yes gene_type:complete
MRLLVENYGEVRIFSERPYGYKRYYVQWKDGTEQLFSGLWYSEKKVRQIVEEQLNA